jgi:hypothetical protein
MDDKFRPVYKSLFESYGTTAAILPRYSGDSLAAAGAISKEIEGVQDELELDQLPRLREDAKYFLLVCLLEIVYIPLKGAAPGQGLLAIVPGFSEDIKTIALAASQQAKQQNLDFVSTHMVVDALHNNWTKLKSGVDALWEKAN